MRGFTIETRMLGDAVEVRVSMKWWARLGMKMAPYIVRLGAGIIGIGVRMMPGNISGSIVLSTSDTP